MGQSWREIYCLFENFQLLSDFPVGSVGKVFVRNKGRRRFNKLMVEDLQFFTGVKKSSKFFVSHF